MRLGVTFYERDPQGRTKEKGDSDGPNRTETKEPNKPKTGRAGDNRTGRRESDEPEGTGKAGKSDSSKTLPKLQKSNP